MFNPGFPVSVNHKLMTFEYGPGVFGPQVEQRHLDDIRQSLLDPHAQGPDVVYSIAMDIGLRADRADLEQRMLLFGAVTYAAGNIGREPVRSQGHIHAISPSCNYSTAEVYEVWSGKCIVLMQETAQDNPERVYAVTANPGEVLIVPPGWAHATINGDPDTPLSFGAWCIRDYGFEYADVRAHHGLAFYPILDDGGGISWRHNDNYDDVELIEKRPQDYHALGMVAGTPIYQQYRENHGQFNFVTRPQEYMDVWQNYEP